MLSNKKMRVIWNFPETRLEFLISSWIHSMILPPFVGDITKDEGGIIPLILCKVIVQEHFLIFLDISLPSFQVIQCLISPW